MLDGARSVFVSGEEPTIYPRPTDTTQAISKSCFVRRGALPARHASYVAYHRCQRQEAGHEYG